MAWNKLADLSKRFLVKGRQVYVEGRLRTREWDDRDGNKRRTTEVIASQMVLLGSRPEGMEAGGAAASAPSYRSAPEAEEPAAANPTITDDDIPF